MKYIKKGILVCILSLFGSTVYSQTENIVKAEDAHDINNSNFKSYNCKSEILKKTCLRYESDTELFQDRKDNFKKNRVTYFFNPEKLVEGFSTPEVFNRLMDDAFKNLKKSDVTPIILKQTNNMSLLLKESFKKNVQEKLSVNVMDKNDKIFVKDYHNSVTLFKRKLDIFHWIVKDKERIKEFQAIYLESKNELENQPETMIRNKNEGVKCVAVEYELLKNNKWNSKLSCHLK